MAMPFFNHTETPLNFPKLKKNPKKSNLNSSRAFLLSTLFYISVFYVFDLSPSSLLCTTTFWFVILNTLILILAADFGASRDRDVFDEYEKYNAGVVPKMMNAAPSYEMVVYVRNDGKPAPKYRGLQVEEAPQEKIISVDGGACKAIQSQVLAPSLTTTEQYQTDQQTAETKPDDTFPTDEKLIIKEKLEKRKREQFRKRRTRTMSAVGEAEKAAGKKVLQRTLSERHEEEEAPPPRSEENEFSRMSDEELNRRVEEFIRRCNRQIRLEG